MHKELFCGARSARIALALAVVCAILAALATIAQMTLLSEIVARVFLGHQTLPHVTPLLFSLLAVAFARALLLMLRTTAGAWAATGVTMAVRGRLVAHLLRLGPAYSAGERTGDLVTTASEGVERLNAYVSGYLPQVVLSAAVPLLIAGYVLTLDWASAVLLLVTGPIIPLLMFLVGSYARDHVRRQWTELAYLGAHFLDAVQGLPTLVFFGRASAERARVVTMSRRLRETTMKVIRLASLSGLVLEFMAGAAIALVAVTLGVRLLDGGITFSRAFLVLLLAPEFYRPLRELGAHYHAGMEGKAAAGRILEILRTPVAADNGAALRRPAGGLALSLSDVTYTYPGHTRAALEGVTLRLPANTCTALVGPSGAGKSTLVALLLRFREPQGGTMIANGIPLSTLSVDAWREQVALVPQHPYLFYGTVRENIRLARPTASDHEVQRAAEQAGASTFIAGLPLGFDTPVGERGTRLSAGQVQRLAIARAILKDAPLVILDEPTSSLDPESESMLGRSLRELRRGRTVLVVAHRRATIAVADQVAVLNGGRLVESRPPQGQESVVCEMDAAERHQERVPA
jgi:ATP-binding cassette subfamily C protein CydD